jgi:hypothetical protein
MGLVIVVDYEWNKDYIATYLCENKDRPVLECEGKCYLMQSLKNKMNESADHKAKQLTQISKIEIMDMPRNANMIFSIESTSFPGNDASHSLSAGYSAKVFQPPSV